MKLDHHTTLPYPALSHALSHLIEALVKQFAHSWVVGMLDLNSGLFVLSLGLSCAFFILSSKLLRPMATCIVLY